MVRAIKRGKEGVECM